MMRLTQLARILVGGVLVATSAVSQEARREVGPHVHGSGRLNIAIENNRISLDLDAPANDILGFEHAPKTQEQKAILEAAVAKLKDATGIFRISSEAGCTLVKSEAGLEQPDALASDKADSSEHADFNAAIEFECRSIDKLRDIDLGYFAAFRNAARLDVSIVTARSQATREASPDAPRIDLTGLN